MDGLNELIKQDVQEVCTVEDVLSEARGLFLIEDILAFGRSRHRFYQVMPEKGVLTEPIQIGDWSFEELNDFTTLPGFAQKIWAEFQEAGFPYDQVILGRELTVNPETKPPEINMPEVDWGKVGKATLAVAGAVAVGAALLVFSSAAAAMTVVDPKLIVRVRETWICLVSWAD